MVVSALLRRLPRGSVRRRLRVVAVSALAALATGVSAAGAAEVTTLWQESFYYKEYEDAAGEMNAVAVAPDGGFCLAGRKQVWRPETDDRDLDVWALRLDAAGAVLFERAFGAKGNQRPYGVAAPADGGCTVAGFHGFVQDDSFILRASPSGDLLWRRAFGGPFGDSALAVAAMPDGDTVVSSYEVPSPDARSVMRLDRFDRRGNLVWTRRPEGIAPGGRRIAALDNGHVLVSGALWIRDAPFGYSAVEFDENGEEVWSATLHVGRPPRAKVAVPGAGHAIAFYDENAKPWPTVRVMRFDARAQELWRAEAQPFDDNVPLTDYGSYGADIALLADGSIALVIERDFLEGEVDPRSYSDHWLLVFDPDGRLKTRRVLAEGRPVDVDTVERVYAAAATPDGGFVIVGKTLWPRDADTGKRIDVWLRKLAPP